MASMQAMKSWLEKNKPAELPPINISIMMPDFVGELVRRLGTPDGDALQTRDQVRPRP